MLNLGNVPKYEGNGNKGIGFGRAVRLRKPVPTVRLQVEPCHLIRFCTKTFTVVLTLRLVPILRDAGASRTGGSTLGGGALKGIPSSPHLYIIILTVLDGLLLRSSEVYRIEKIILSLT